MSDYAELKIRVNHNALGVIDDTLVTSGTINAIKVSYVFDTPEWASLRRSAVFSRDGETYTVDITSDGSCFIPPDVLLTDGEFFVGACGDGDNIRLPTEYLRVKIKVGSYTDNPATSEDRSGEINTFLAELAGGVYGYPSVIDDEDYGTAIINVKHNALSMYKTSIFTRGSVNSLRIRFLYKTDDWDTLTKAASITSDGVTYIAMPDEDGYIYVPHEVLDEGTEFWVGLFGVKENTLLTTELIRFDIENGAATDGLIPGEATISGFEELIEMFQNKQDKLIAGENITITDDNVISASADIGDKSFTFTQSIPSDTWTIEHGLGKKPSVTVVDSADNVVVGNVQYIDLNSLEITFVGAFSGKAYLN